jgi:uncharacterized protein (DUF58 family)
VELRAYVPGDDVRRIDWAATARSGDLQTRVILEDVALTLAVILDASASMRVGRRRPLLASAREAVSAWFAAAMADDRCLQVAADFVTPSGLQRTAHAALASIRSNAGESFDVARTLRTARGALPRGTALLAVSDWYDLGPEHAPLLAELGARYDCTALIVRDPWHDDLPLQGIVRIRGAEGGFVRAYIGPREQQAFRRAVREREASVTSHFARANWRTGILYERDGAASLGAAFGLRPGEARAR